MNKLLIFFALVFLVSCMGRHDSDAKKAEISKKVESAKGVSGDTLEIDTNRSIIYWKGTKMRGTRMHSGEINLMKGFFLMKSDQIVGGEFLVDMKTIKVTDIPLTDPIPIKNLTNHLKDSDFFDVGRYPYSRFEILEVKRLSADSIEISGNLTIKDVTKNIRIDALQREKSFTSSFVIDRFQWNIAYEGNWANRTLVDKEIELKVDLVWN